VKEIEQEDWIAEMTVVTNGHKMDQSDILHVVCEAELIS
jgi:hypothetical protein